MRPLHLLPVLILVAGGVATCPPASGQIPCRYEIEAIIQAPPCPIFGPPATIATAINARGDVAGFYYQCDPTNREAFAWTRESGLFTIPRPPGVLSAAAAGINDNRVVCGTWWRSNVYGGQRGFIYDLDRHMLIAELEPAPGGAWCSIGAMNQAGTVCGMRSIGPSNDPPEPQTAFLWSPTNGYTDLGVIDNRRTWAADLNEAGSVVGGIGSIGNPYLSA
jgi:uncharacterized membrane protein